MPSILSLFLSLFLSLSPQRSASASAFLAIQSLDHSLPVSALLPSAVDYTRYILKDTPETETPETARDTPDAKDPSFFPSANALHLEPDLDLLLSILYSPFFPSSSCHHFKP